MDLPRYKLEMDRIRARSKELEGISHDLGRRSDQERDSKSALRHLESFCHRVADGLDNMSFEKRQEFLRLVVDRVTVENGAARIDTVIPGQKDVGQLRTRRSELVEPYALHNVFRWARSERIPSPTPVGAIRSTPSVLESSGNPT
jgi:hypothetical protein